MKTIVTMKEFLDMHSFYNINRYNISEYFFIKDIDGKDITKIGFVGRTAQMLMLIGYGYLCSYDFLEGLK